MVAAVKKVYRVTNWSQYSDALVQRGSITFWFSEAVLDNWFHANDDIKVGRPFTYSDRAIESCLIVRELFRLPYRQTEGFARSLLGLLRADLPVPDFSALSKRATALNVTLAAPPRRGPIDVVVDSTGLKVFGEGEWKMRKHGKSKRRTWRKLHLAIDPNTHDIVAEVLTTNAATDADAMDDLLRQAPQKIRRCTGDGAYDKWKVYRALAARGIQPVIPPQRNAKIKRHGNSAETPLPRDAAIRGIREQGRRKWKEEIGYHVRSLAETAMHRMKSAFGDELKNRELENQATEARLRCKILNHFTRLGMPNFQYG